MGQLPDTGSPLIPPALLCGSIVTLDVTDTFNFSNETTTLVTVSDIGTNVPPIASFRVQNQNLFVSFFDTGTYDPDGQIVRYSLDFGDGSSADTIPTSHLYESPIVYEARLTVVDNTGNLASASQVVDLSAAVRSPSPPIARISLTVQGQDLTVYGSASTASFGTIVRYRWIFPSPTPGFDLRSMKVARSGQWIFLFANVTDKILPLSKKNSISFFLETDARAPGFDIAGIHANFLVRVTGGGGSIQSSRLLWYFDPRLPGVSGTWQDLSAVPAAVSDSAVEIQTSSSVLLISEKVPIRVTCVLELSGAFVDTFDGSMSA